MSDKPRILVIDDSALVTETVSAALSRDGFEVRAATTLAELHGILKTWSPTVVLTDVDMPGMTGPELCRWIKVRIETHSVPVVLFSDLPDHDLDALAETAGADGFVSKSKGMDNLSQELAAFCEGIVW